MMKMYILIQDFVPNRPVPVIVAHAALACYKKFEYDEEMNVWMNGIFKKVVCKVNDKGEEKSVLLTESALENKEVCPVFCPRAEYSKQFNYFRMWTPNQE